MKTLFTLSVKYTVYIVCFFSCFLTSVNGLMLLVLYAVLKLVLGFTYVNSLKGLQNALHYYIILHILHT